MPLGSFGPAPASTGIEALHSPMRPDTFGLTAETLVLTMPSTNMQAATTTEIKDNTANPAPLGLLAFGMTTVLLNLHNAGCFELNSMILAMGIFYGGLAQVVAGIMEWKKNNTFGTTAFISYGFFWLSLVALILIPKFGLPALVTTKDGMSAYLAVWGLFTAVMFLATLRLNRALQFIFASPHHPLFPVGDRGLHRKRRPQAICRLRRNRLRPLRHVRRAGPGAQRSFCENRPPARARQEIELIPR